MMRSEFQNWSETDWENAFKEMIDIAQEKIETATGKMRSAITVKTSRNKIYSVLIPDIGNMEEREEVESIFLRKLVDNNDTEVSLCVAILPEKSITIPSWNFRRKLMDINPENGDTEILLQGYEKWLVKQLKTTLPK